MITVNGTKISEKEFDNACYDFKVRNRIPALKKDMLTHIANQIVDSNLLLQASKNEKIDVDTSEVEAILENIKKNFPDDKTFADALSQSNDTEESLKEKIADDILLKKFINNSFVEKITVDDAEVKGYYDANTAQFTTPSQVKASHILFKEDKKEDAEKTLQELKDGADFAEAAQANSECPSKERGGDLGFFGKGQMVPEFEKASFENEIGLVTELVKTQFGYHIINVDEKKEGKNLTFDEVKNDIVNMLTNQKVDSDLTSFLKELKEKATIEIDNTLLDKKAE